MIIGAHVIIQSKEPRADQALLKRLGLPSLTIPDGVTIYGLPPAEVAIHLSDKNDIHEFYLMCDDVRAMISILEKEGIAASPIREAGWGDMTMLTLPGGGRLGIYEPRHPRPRQHKPRRKTAARKAPARKARTAKKRGAASRTRARR